MFKYLFKFITISLILIIVMSAIFVGTVSAENAIAISTKEEFYNIRNNLSGNYYLTCDIEFSGSDFAYKGSYHNSGKCFEPIGSGRKPFTGTFDGRGYTVSGIKVSVSGYVYSMSVTPINTGISTLGNDWTDDYIIDQTSKYNVSPTAGIFGSNEGTIKNLNVINCTIIVNSKNTADLYIGGITGHNKGDILNCSVKNTLNCNAKSYIGGIAGYQSGGNIKNCSVFGKIESEGIFGGIAGAAAGGNITECYTDVNFTGNSAASIGLAGIDIRDNITNCFYVANTKLDGVGELITIRNAKDPSKYINFDFSTTWYMSGTLRRPALKIHNLASGTDITAGDLNADKKLNLADLVLLAQYVAKWDIEVNTDVANVNYNFTENGDDVIDLQDVGYLAKYLAGWNSAVLY